MYGGKKLGEGSYGIAYSPAFNCTSGRTFGADTIGKVFTDETEAQKEWEVAERIRAIDNKGTQKLFAYPSEMCDVSIAAAAKREPSLTLAIYQRTLARPSKTIKQLVMTHGGMTLSQYMKRYYLEKNKRIGRAELLKLLENLFYGVKRLNDHGYTHQDIKADNIVVSNSRRLRLIDFGLMHHESTFYNTELILLHDYNRRNQANPNRMSPYAFTNQLQRTAVPMNHLLYTGKYIFNPPEYMMYMKQMSDLQYLAKHPQQVINLMDGHKNIDTPPYPEPKPLSFLDKAWFEYYNIGRADHSSYKARDQGKDLAEFLAQVSQVSGQQRLQYWTTNKFATKSDPYAIGIALLLLSPQLKPSAQEEKRIVLKFRELVRGLLHPSPLHRFDINQAITVLKQIQAMAKRAPNPSDNLNPFEQNRDDASLRRVLKPSPRSMSSTLGLDKLMLSAPPPPPKPAPRSRTRKPTPPADEAPPPPPSRRVTRSMATKAT